MMYPEKSGQEINLFKRSINTTVIGITGAWLFLLYPLLVWFVIGTMSARGFQDKVQKLGNGNEQFTVYGITKMAKELSGLQEMEAQARRKLDQIEIKHAGLAQKYESDRAKHEEKLKQEDALYSTMKARVRFLESRESSGKQQPDAAIQDRAQVLAERDSELKNVLQELRKKAPETEDAERSVRQSVRELKQVESEKKTAEAALEGVGNKQKVFMEKRQQNDMVSELQYMEIFNFDVFATMPGQLLTFLLTLSMGSLGSLIYITRDYFRNKEKPFSWYLFRPFLGMVTAVAIFILVKAGQITISDAGLKDGIEENLNPFFISFLAIISGLLSEQAIERIRAAGISVFRGNAPDEGQARWAVGVKEALETQKRDVADLLPYVDAPLATVQAWIEERESIPQDKQIIVASWLNLPARRLFTDMAPARNGETATGEE